jgi:hypothetical protein
MEGEVRACEWQRSDRSLRAHDLPRHRGQDWTRRRGHFHALGMARQHAVHLRPWTGRFHRPRRMADRDSRPWTQDTGPSRTGRRRLWNACQSPRAVRGQRLSGDCAVNVRPSVSKPGEVTTGDCWQVVAVDALYDVAPLPIHSVRVHGAEDPAGNGRRDDDAHQQRDRLRVHGSLLHARLFDVSVFAIVLQRAGMHRNHLAIRDSIAIVVPGLELQLK